MVKCEHMHGATTPSGQTMSVQIGDSPDECPLCHTKGHFSHLALYYNQTSSTGDKLEAVYRCPNSKCYEVFIGYYVQAPNGVYLLKRSEPKRHHPRRFDDLIKGISPDFVLIYNQALKAENDNLDQICGPGYRKAFEYLIKDYLIKKISDVAVQKEIKSEFLGNSIASRIQDVSIKEVAKRAVWLGNDETHYVRKWDQKDLQDLKKLIDLTVHWMEAEALTAQLLNEMQEPVKNK